MSALGSLNVENAIAAGRILRHLLWKRILRDAQVDCGSRNLPLRAFLLLGQRIVHDFRGRLILRRGALRCADLWRCILWLCRCRLLGILKDAAVEAIQRKFQTIGDA